MDRNSTIRLFIVVILSITLFGFTKVNNTPPKKYSVLDQVLTTGILRVGVTADYVPFAYYDNNANSYQGIDIDLANQLAKDMEVELALVPTTRASLTRDILLGKFDVAMSGIPRTMQQTLVTNMTTGYFESGKSLLIKKEDKERIKDVNSADKSGYIIGVKKATTSQKFAELHFKKAQVQLYQNLEEISNALKNGNIDVVLTDNIEAKVLADKDRTLHAVDPYNPLNTEVLAFAMSPGDKKWQDFLNLWVSHQLQEGEVIRLQKKWIGE